MRTVGIVGGPVQVARSLSPAIHNAAFETLEMDWLYVGLPVEEGQLKEALTGLMQSGIQGFNVTMPHKVAIVDLLDMVEGDAQTIGSVNIVDVREGKLTGSSTDGEGFIRFLRRDLGLDPDGMAVAIIGAGGAARAIVAALSRAGASSITVLARDKKRAQVLGPLSVGSDFIAEELGQKATYLIDAADLVVNATPVGQMEDKPLLTEGTFRHGMTVVDLVYRPSVTPLMSLARRAGATAHGGLGMLLHQAGLSFRIWTGLEPPLEAMSAAAIGELARVQEARE